MSLGPLDSMFAAFLREGEGKETLSSADGFLTYGFNCVPGLQFEHVYIESLYVTPEMRKSHVASDLADRVCAIAKERGIKFCLGSVSANRSGADANFEILKRYGMRILSAHENTIWMIKGI